jgi:hypothetical protein
MNNLGPDKKLVFSAQEKIEGRIHVESKIYLVMRSVDQGTILKYLTKNTLDLMSELEVTIMDDRRKWSNSTPAVAFEDEDPDRFGGI